MPTTLPTIACVLALAGGGLLVGAPRAYALAQPGSVDRVPQPWKNCTVVNKRYPHGIGKAHAHDKTSGTPVTNFKRDTKRYERAMHYNRALDRDRDGIACEKH